MTSRMQQRNNLGRALVLLAVAFVWSCNKQLPTANATTTTAANQALPRTQDFAFDPF